MSIVIRSIKCRNQIWLPNCNLIKIKKKEMANNIELVSTNGTNGHFERPRHGTHDNSIIGG